MPEKKTAKTSSSLNKIFKHFKQIFSRSILLVMTLFGMLAVIIIKVVFKSYQQYYAREINNSTIETRNIKDFRGALAFSFLYSISIPVMEIVGFFIEAKIISIAFVIFYSKFLKYNFNDWSFYLNGDLYSVILRRSKALSSLTKTLFSETLDNFAYIIFTQATIFITYGARFVFVRIILILLIIPAVINAITLVRNYTISKTHEAFDCTEKKLKDIFMNYELIHTHNMVEVEIENYAHELRKYLFWFKLHWIVNNVIEFVKKMLNAYIITKIFTIILSSPELTVIQHREDGVKKIIDTYNSLLKRNVAFTMSIKKIFENSELILKSNLDNLSIDENPGEMISKKIFEKEISVQNLSKSYGDCEIFKDVNLKIKKGEKIAITGHNGTGKTSFTKILANLEKHGGKIQIDGVNLSDIENKDLRRLIGFVPQDDSLFEASIMDNLTMFDSSIPNEDIFKKIDEFGMHQDIKAIGYDRNIVDNGSNLSSGERQKICFLRAVIRDTPILIFDEITSRMDKMQESEIISKVMTNLKDHTVIMIIHNLNLIENFDKIIFFGNGTATKALPLDELKIQSPEFLEYYNKAII